MKENSILQAPPEVSKWFIKREKVNFDLVMVHVGEHLNIAICFNCNGYGHVTSTAQKNRAVTNVDRSIGRPQDCRSEKLS